MGIVNSEEIKEVKRLERDRNLYPPFLVEEFRKTRKEIRIREKTGRATLCSLKRITDFIPLIHSIWTISNKEFQERFWVRNELPDVILDYFDQTTEIFEEDAEAVLDTKDYSVEMTDKQRKMLAELLRLVEDYDGDPATPISRYGENDALIVSDSRWDKIRQYAKQVYEEITGESADL